jgi:hypothetical protein
MVCIVNYAHLAGQKYIEGEGGKDEIVKVENQKSKSQINQDIYNHEGRKMTRKEGRKR